MATTTSCTEESIVCDLCDKAALRFCNNCQSSLCVDCVGKHVHEHDSIPHDIVPFRYRKLRLVVPECDFHPGQRCEIHCQQCNTPVCVMCYIGPHKGHDAVELTKVIEIKREQIKRDTEELKNTLVPKYLIADTSNKSKITKLREEFFQMNEEIKRLRKVWHQEVDAIFHKASDLIKSIQDNTMASLAIHENEIEKRISEIKQTIGQQQEILKSNRATAFNSFASKLREYREIPKDVEVTAPSLVTETVDGKELRIELETFKANLVQTSVSKEPEVSFSSTRQLLEKARVIASIFTNQNPLCNVACVKVGQAWVSGENKIIALVDKQGFVQDRVSVKDDDGPNGIALTKHTELLYTESTNRTVNIVTLGRIKTLITTPYGWIPWGICSTKLGDILVSVRKLKKNKILRYQGSTVALEIFKDEYGKQIFTEGEQELFITENNNGDVCVSDQNAKTVVVVDRTGRVRFQYDGSPVRMKEAFDPRYIITDSLSQIIVADMKNGCLHILDKFGYFLKCIDNCGIYEPGGMSVDSEGRLWVGLYCTGEIKVIQYLT